MSESVDNDNQNLPRKRRYGLFFPLLLITLGVFFLLYNLGVISGDVWSLLWQFWPVLLIVGGLDSIFKRQSLVSAIFFIGVGIILLLANLGYLNISIWQLIFTLWPVALIAIGFDILFGRRSIWLSIIGIVLVLAVLAGSLALFGVQPQLGTALIGEQISQELDGATRANVSIETGAGELLVSSPTAADILISGTVPEGSAGAIQSSYSVSNGTGSYNLRGTEGNFIMTSANLSRWSWNLLLNDQIPMVLLLSLGAGDMRIDLRDLDIQSMQANFGAGHGMITLPEEGSLDAKLSGGIGQLEILVPPGMEVLIRADTALAGISIPDGYQRLDDIIKSPGYDQSENRATIDVNMAIGDVRVREAP